MTTPENSPSTEPAGTPTPPNGFAPFSAHLPAFTRVVETTTAWEAPSACAGWSAADVLDHVIDSQRDFLAERVGPVGDRPGGAPEQRWHAHLQLITTLVDHAARASEFEGLFGPTTVGQTLDLFYTMDLIVHRWDIAQADNREEVLTDTELDQVEEAARAGGPALRMEGICKEPVTIADDAQRQERVLAFLGRDPRN